MLISRGSLVEIGGGFRVPDVMAQSGAILREAGTTNRTCLADLGRGDLDRTAFVLRVNPSNFRIEGFTERPDVAGLAALAHDHGLPLADDLGSGHLRTPSSAGGSDLWMNTRSRASRVLTGTPCGVGRRFDVEPVSAALAY